MKVRSEIGKAVSPPGPTEPPGNAVVLLVNCLGGPELEVVHETLTTSLRTPTVLLGPADFTSPTLALDLASGLVTLPEGPVRPVVVWVRHADAGTLLSREVVPGVIDPLGAAYWSDFLQQFGAAAAVRLPGAHLSRIGQVVAAAALGVRTPRTVVTTDVAAAAHTLGTPSVIVKSPDFRLFAGDPGTWPVHLPRVLRREEAAAQCPAPHPVLVQEYLTGCVELRVYDLDGAICAFRVDKAEPAGPWTDPAGVTVRAVPCPEGVARVVRRLSSAWGLCFAAFDLLVPPVGDPVFLEANPDGDWLWFERRAAWHGVSLTAAVMVGALYVRTTARGAPAG